jgi:hypothetical protein
MEREVEAWLRRKFEGRLQEVEVVHKEDLDLVSSSCRQHDRGDFNQQGGHVAANLLQKTRAAAASHVGTICR